MNMNKALQNLYHAVSNETTTKVNISKLLVDIHYAITGKESPNKNNWSKIVNSMADNWPEGGGGSSDFSTATVTIVGTTPDVEFECVSIDEDGMHHTISVSTGSGTATVVLYQGSASLINNNEYEIMSISGDIEYDVAMDEYTITGDCTITIS